MGEVLGRLAQESAEQLLGTLESLGARGADPLKTRWADLEQPLSRLLKGPYQPSDAAHRDAALGLAALIGLRLQASLGAFWFTFRDAPGGVAMGFPEAMQVVSPLLLAEEALRAGRMTSLDAQLTRLSEGLREASAARERAGEPAVTLGPSEYRRQLDPGLLSLIALDRDRARAALQRPSAQLVETLRVALERARTVLSAEVTAQLEKALVQPLAKLPAATPPAGIAAAHPRLLELLSHLFGATGVTPAATEELWTDLAFPLLRLGAPDTFPLADPDLLARESEPLGVYLKTMLPAPDLDQLLLGTFPIAELTRPLPELAAGATAPRLFEVSRETLLAPLGRFDPAASIRSFKAFCEQVTQQSGQALTPSGRSLELLNSALALVSALRPVVEVAGNPTVALCLRRVTEGEARAEPALSLLRSALEGQTLEVS